MITRLADRSPSDGPPVAPTRRRTVAVLSALATVAAAVVLGTVSASAPASSAAAGTLSFTPTSGPVGTVISVTGTCTPSEGTPTISMYEGGTQLNAFIFSRDVVLTPQGALSGTITIPDRHAISGIDPTLTVPVVPGDTFDVYATCDAQGRDAFKAPGTFTVEATPTTTTTSTTTVPTSSTTSTTTVPTSSTTSTTTVPASSTTSSPTTSAPPTGAPGVTVDRPDVTAGGTVTVRGQGFAADTPLEVELHSTPVRLASIRSSSDGSFVTTVAIPTDTAAGRHEIVVSGLGAAGQARSVSVALVVAGATTTPTAGPSSTSPAPKTASTPPSAGSASGARARSGSPRFTG